MCIYDIKNFSSKATLFLQMSVRLSAKLRGKHNFLRPYFRQRSDILCAHFSHTLAIFYFFIINIFLMISNSFTTYGQSTFFLSISFCFQQRSHSIMTMSVRRSVDKLRLEGNVIFLAPNQYRYLIFFLCKFLLYELHRFKDYIWKCYFLSS